MSKTVAGISGGAAIAAIVLLILFIRSRKSSANGAGTVPIFVTGGYIQLKDNTGKIWQITRIQDGVYYLSATDGSATTAWNASYVEEKFKTVSYP
jgi:hypothetical protein